MNLFESIQIIDQLKKELDELRPLSPEVTERVIQKFRMDWTFHSNRIEGNSLNYGETKIFLLHGLTAQGKPLEHHLEIKGHNEAVHELEELVRQQIPLTETIIRQLHQVILPASFYNPSITPDGKSTGRKITPGRYKAQPNHVRTVSGEMFYFASPEETPAKMEELLNWYHAAMQDPAQHPVSVAAELHYRFVMIHPFDDGNGRISRLLMNLVLMMKGFPPVVIKAHDKLNYLNALQLADGGNLTPFIFYVAEQLITSLHISIDASFSNRVEEAFVKYGIGSE